MQKTTNPISKLINFFKKKRLDSQRFDTLIDKSVEITGDVTFDGNMIINGIVRGNITDKSEKNTSAVIIGGEIYGSVTADFVIISGFVMGDVTAKQTINIKKSGSVHGNIAYQNLQIEEGAVISGFLKKHLELNIPIKSDSELE